MNILRRSLSLLLLFIALEARAQGIAATLTQHLTQDMGIKTKELAAIERGEVLVKSLDTHQDREVTILGVMSISASRETLVRQARDHATWLRTATRTRLGIFSDPPRLADLQSLAIDPSIIEELKKCRPGSCAVKLPSAVMDDVRTQLAGAADPAEQLNAFTRQRILGYVQEYRAHGDSSMVVYDDNNPVRASGAFDYLLTKASKLPQYVPGFAAYLAGYPHVALDGVEDTFFWAQESAPNLRNTVMLTHQAIYSPPELAGLTLIAEKQIYASHYLEAALDVTAIVDRPAGGSYVVVVRRLLFDALPGGLFGVRRRAVNSLRDRTSAELQRIRGLIER